MTGMEAGRFQEQARVPLLCPGVWEVGQTDTVLFQQAGCRKEKVLCRSFYIFNTFPQMYHLSIDQKYSLYNTNENLILTCIIKPTSLTASIHSLTG